MLIQPIYNILILPDITYFFKKDFFNTAGAEDLVPGTEILFVFLKDALPADSVTPDHIYPVGISAKIEALGEEDNLQIHTLERVHLTQLTVTDHRISASVSVLPETADFSENEENEQFAQIKNSLLKFVQGYQWGIWARGFILQRKNLYDTASALSEYLNLTASEKYEILSVDSRRERCRLIEKAINEFMEIGKVSAEAQAAQKDGQEQRYREAAIKKQIDYLQQELDNMHPENISDIRKFERKIEVSGMNEEARKEALKVLDRMKQEGKDSHEYGMLYDYLDFLTSLSWTSTPFSSIDLDRAETVLDEDHYGLKKVKERMIQQIAVMALNQSQHGSILLFTGPPGTGKTSLGQSIARALGRKYVRISLGGIRDEAEIRGHRRTYIGAMPGRIMEGMKRSGVSNPVIVLDEVDKLSKDYGGDPASALLEVLDPEQNHSFTDHYMNVPYDLSNVLFVCTANSTDTIPEPLLNRMEVISFAGYTASEKYHIAKKHLIPRAMSAMNIPKKRLRITDAALRHIIEDYTMEAGVRDLKKHLDMLCRTAAVNLVRHPHESLTITRQNLHTYMGKRQLRHERRMTEGISGVSTGLAWTRAGGEILFIESRMTEGKGLMTITGQLGEVMKESVEIAVTLVKAFYPKESRILRDHDLHIHVPSGAVPKDGPSAGIALTAALASLITGKRIDPSYAMTGEVSLRGRILPIGGLPEKLMAAQRSGIQNVLIPADNREDLADVSEEIRKNLNILPVKTIQEALKLLLNS